MMTNLILIYKRKNIKRRKSKLPWKYDEKKIKHIKLSCGGVKKKNKNQFLEQVRNNELNSKNLYIHCIHIIWSRIKLKSTKK